MWERIKFPMLEKSKVIIESNLKEEKKNVHHLK